MSSYIHETAIVSKKAKIGENVNIGPFAIIEDDVEIGDGTVIKSSAVIENGARIGKDCLIYVGALISGQPQDLKYNNERSFAIIGDRTVVREYATVHRGTGEGGETVIGEDCLLMAYTHVAHDCVLGNHVILSNLAHLGGHAIIEEWAILSGFVKIHQFCRVGKHSMVGADVKVVKDVAPYNLIGKIPAKYEGINKIGLKRRGFADTLIKEIQQFYDTLMISGFNISDGIKEFQKRQTISEEVLECIAFIKESKRGVTR